MKKLKVILIGAGNRGITYTDIMAKNREKYEVIAVAEPKEDRRRYIQKKHGLPDEMCFADWEPLLALGKIADLALIATMDKGHFAPAMQAIDLGYDLLLEKPISTNAGECLAISQNAKKHQVRVIICTVLRYTPLFMKLKELIDGDRIGRVMSINHEECVGNVHQSHSFVRGNWGNEGRSSFMLLQKSCHDIDILQWLLGEKCKKVQSFGSLEYFTEKNAPSGAPDYCIEGCPNGENCPYNAVKLYLEDKKNDWFRTASTGLTAPTDADVEKAISETQYGRCVYRCDNDVVDHQTVNMLFEGGATVTFTMNAFNKGGRFIHIMGTKGEIRASLADGDEPIRLFDFQTRTTEEIESVGKDGLVSGHGGGDDGIVEAVYEYLNGCYTGNSIPDIAESCANHLTTFAIEQARRTGTIVDMEQFERELAESE